MTLPSWRSAWGFSPSLLECSGLVWPSPQCLSSGFYLWAFYFVAVAFLAWRMFLPERQAAFYAAAGGHAALLLDAHSACRHGQSGSEFGGRAGHRGCGRIVPGGAHHQPLCAGEAPEANLRRADRGNDRLQAVPDSVQVGAPRHRKVLGIEDARRPRSCTERHYGRGWNTRKYWLGRKSCCFARP